jgi:hypothetical protein
VACGLMFRIDRCPLLKHVNSEVVEGWHSIIKKLSTHMASMSLLTFTFTLCNRLQVWSIRKRILLLQRTDEHRFRRVFLRPLIGIMVAIAGAGAGAGAVAGAGVGA